MFLPPSMPCGVHLCPSVAILYGGTSCFDKSGVFCLQEGNIVRASKQISSALACADRHIGPCTTSISIRTQAVQDSLINIVGQSQTSPSPFILPNVISLDLVLGHESGNGESIRQLASSLLQRLPNLVAARLWYHSCDSEASLVPLAKVKHLDLCMQNCELLEEMAFGPLLPALETAHVSCALEEGPLRALDFSGCQHMVRLVVGITVRCLLKPPQCKLRASMMRDKASFYKDTSMAQQGLPSLEEVLLDTWELHSSQGLLTRVCLPELQVIRCRWLETSSDKDDTLVHCLRHSRNVPALKSILCGDWKRSDNRPAVEVRIPASLAGVHEIILAAKRPLVLAFDSACSAGERLNTFCVVGSEVSIDAAALLAMTDALIKRGLTLSMAQAGPEHAHAPSQCMYVRALCAPQLSYDDAIQIVNERVERWSRHWQCGCGACFECLRRAGVLA